ncbi:hypothetical protein ACHAW5_008828 [Stephanodiscus triporus]|uniref:Subtilisin n=1 Tax=Stephanodiscus triporus TaxID=2934178 RepID=A0ABD3MYK9_9STRA
MLTMTYGLQTNQTLSILASLFTRGGGYVGIINTRTKGQSPSFVSQVIPTRKGRAPPSLTAQCTWHTGPQKCMNEMFLNHSGVARPRHSSQTADGLQCIVMSNLHGKAIERINVVRNGNGDIISAIFDTDASLGLGTIMTVVEAATYFSRNNGYGSALSGGVECDYRGAALQDLTPDGKCKENGCDLPGVNGGGGGQSNNRPVCPIPSSQGNLL